jgi:hypothetical protein
MSKLARALALAAMLTAMQLAGMTALAQAHTTDQPTGQADATVRRLLAREQPSGTPGQAASDAAHQQALAQERYYSTWGSENPAIQQALAQERAYRTSGYGDTAAPVPAEPGGQPGWLTPALGVLSVVLALVGGVAVLATRRAHRSQRASQTA